MSLINQVLQDLEKRHASAPELESLPPHVRTVPHRPRPPIGMLALFAAGIVAVAVVVLFRSGWPLPWRSAKVDPVPLIAPRAVPALQAVSAPVVEPARITAFDPVSRISHELGLVALSPARRETQPNAPGNAGTEVVARSAVVSPAPIPEVKELQLAAVAPPPKVEPAIPQPVSRSEDAPAPRPAPVATPEENVPPAIEKQMRETTPQMRAEIAFRKGVGQLQQGRPNAAETDFRDALKQDPSHAGACQALLGLLLDSGRNTEAEEVLRKALEINPRQPRHAMLLARLEVERGEVTGAVNTMVGALPYVQSDPDYHAFLAALLQREGRHREAIDYYRSALRGVPGNGVWMMGLGISLRAAAQSAEARDAFQRAIDSNQLSPELRNFVERQLRELSASKKK
jgi:MSHA biogenesis protein MshN